MGDHIHHTGNIDDFGWFGYTGKSAHPVGFAFLAGDQHHWDS